MASREASLRLNAQSIIQSILADSSRVVLGLADLDSTSTLFRAMDADGPYIIILPAENHGYDGQTRHFQISFTIIVYMGIPGDYSDDLTMFDNTWTAIRDALQTVANWTSNPPPDAMQVRGPEARSDLKPLVYKYTIELTFWGSVGDGGRPVYFLTSGGKIVHSNGLPVKVGG